MAFLLREGPRKFIKRSSKLRGASPIFASQTFVKLREGSFAKARQVFSWRQPVFSWRQPVASSTFGVSLDRTGDEPRWLTQATSLVVD
eukprot:CAMPEP_0180133908 /NCGR_PEP_ID=MMETSP0986-20121125/9818_1 /TAXON_ID=697907 /ORGANISM="non described non described, Strain CCMP2293" /LENGTH=87 /DNA_ID=CAMNT_0022074111 /DNA_START=281 /DNA_END=544 /DNA_ORIENTATION=+